MVESVNGKSGLKEASRNNFSRRRFFVSAEDQIHITEPGGGKSWVVNVMSLRPLVVGVNEYRDDELARVGKVRDLRANKPYRVAEKRIFIIATARIGDGHRLLNMIGPVGTKFEKQSTDDVDN